MHFGVFVEALNHSLKVLLSDICRKVFVNGGNTDLFAVADFGTHIAMGSRIVSDENRAKPRSNGESLHLLSYLLFNCVGEGLTVENGCCHRLQARSDLVPKVTFVGEDH